MDNADISVWIINNVINSDNNQSSDWLRSRVFLRNGNLCPVTRLRVKQRAGR